MYAIPIKLVGILISAVVFGSGLTAGAPASLTSVPHQLVAPSATLTLTPVSQEHVRAITFADGTHGTVRYGGVVKSVLSPQGTSCYAPSGYQNYYNAFGGLLAQYGVSQYFCYTGAKITNFHHATSWNVTNLGWHLSWQYVTTLLEQGSYHVEGYGDYTFQSAFNLQTISGTIDINCYGSGYVWISYY